MKINMEETPTFTEFLDRIQAECLNAVVNQSPLGYVLDNSCAVGNWVAEFGVFTGRTLNTIRAKTPAHIPVFGFDSFRGLPEAWRDGFDKGSFDQRGEIINIPDNSVVVKGLIQKSLPPVMALIGAQPLRLLHVDVDIYSAAKYALDTLKENIVSGTVIVFDELRNYPGFEDHEIKALYEFGKETGKDFRVIAVENGTSEQVAVQVL